MNGTRPLQSYPYGQVPPAQLQQRANGTGPQRAPSFTPTGPQRRLAVTGAQPQAPGPETLQAREHPAGTFTAASPWQEWARRALVRPYPYPGRETPFYNGMLRDRGYTRAPALPSAEVSPGTAADAPADGRYRLTAGEILPAMSDVEWEPPESLSHLSPADLMPFAVAEPAHRSWQDRQAAEMLPIPGCDVDSYLRAVDILTSTRARPLATAALPAAGADYSDWTRRKVLADAIEAAAEKARPSRARAYMRLHEAVCGAWDYTVADKLVRNADEAGLVNREDIEIAAEAARARGAA